MKHNTKLLFILFLIVFIQPQFAAKLTFSTSISTITEDSVYAVVEKMPQFPGGNAARIDFLNQNVHYPEEAQKNEEQGRVIVQFVVNTLGEIKNAKVVKSVSPSLNQEALRVINSFPAWIPGAQNGKLVSVYQIIPVSFKYTPVIKDSTTWDINDSTIIMIDSLRMPVNFNLSVLNPSRIGSVKVLKPFPAETKDELIKQYGSLAENGVLILKTKNDDLEILPDSTASISNSSKTEIMPEFPGGEKELIKYLSKNVKYPIVARENGVQGRVVVQFFITSTGKIKDITILKSVESSLDSEAMRVTSLMPDWSPAKLNGKPVNVKFTMPISFKIVGSDYSKGKDVWKKNDKTIVILDNKRLPSGFDISLISMNNLTNYVALKPVNKSKTKKLVEQYGSDAVNGVILIGSKQIEK